MINEMGFLAVTPISLPLHGADDPMPIGVKEP
jgi:hypothetical protein